MYFIPLFGSSNQSAKVAGTRPLLALLSPLHALLFVIVVVVGRGRFHCLPFRPGFSLFVFCLVSFRCICL